jgi:restriction system protein
MDAPTSDARTPPPWRIYQEEVAVFFRSLGLQATTDELVYGVRTSHRVDVAVRWTRFGLNLFWIIECKRWRRRVSKVHVLALQSIVQQVGADRGLMMSEAGFQTGAEEVARRSNVHLMSLSDLRVSAENELGMIGLRSLLSRVGDCRRRYWQLDKDTRIQCGLRPPAGVFGYSVRATLDAVEAHINSGLAEQWPSGSADPADAVLVGAHGVRTDAMGPAELLRDLEPYLQEVERRLTAAEGGKE